MTIAIGMRVQSGPWGGGNQFAVALAKYLEARGVTVTHDLDDRNLDIILLTEPRRSSASSAFNDVDILDYTTHVNPRAIVVHRVNECDERKNTRMVNRRIELANACADRTVFISGWLRDLFARRGAPLADSVVIRNGADRSVFYAGGAVWTGGEPLRIVTHHWSDNWLKGFDIYRRLDDLLGDPAYAKRFAFTYIGKLPAGFRFRNARVEAPRSGAALASLLREHHVYLTASQNEPAGMHHIEGAMCGLPLLYRSSGALPEYCEGFGLAFDDRTFDGPLLMTMRAYYRLFKERMPRYPYDADCMSATYLSLFTQLIEHRDAVLAERRGRPGIAFARRAHAAFYDQYYSWRIRFLGGLR
jgi:hypothetical protein